MSGLGKSLDSWVVDESNRMSPTDMLEKNHNDHFMYDGNQVIAMDTVVTTPKGVTSEGWLPILADKDQVKAFFDALEKDVNGGPLFTCDGKPLKPEKNMTEEDLQLNTKHGDVSYHGITITEDMVGQQLDPAFIATVYDLPPTRMQSLKKVLLAGNRSGTKSEQTDLKEASGMILREVELLELMSKMKIKDLIQEVSELPPVEPIDIDAHGDINSELDSMQKEGFLNIQGRSDVQEALNEMWSQSRSKVSEKPKGLDYIIKDTPSVAKRIEAGEIVECYVSDVSNEYAIEAGLSGDVRCFAGLYDIHGYADTRHHRYYVTSGGQNWKFAIAKDSVIVKGEQK